MSFEDFELPSNRKFGLILSGGLMIFASYMWLWGLFETSALAGLGGLVFLIISLSNPETLLPLNQLWMRIGFMTGKVMGPVVVGVLYYGLVSPVGLMFRGVKRLLAFAKG